MQDVVILGSGPAGLTAAIYTGRANKSTTILAGPSMGGQTGVRYGTYNVHEKTGRIFWCKNKNGICF